MGLFRNVGIYCLALLVGCNRPKTDIDKQGYGIDGLTAEESLVTYLTWSSPGSIVEHCEDIIIRDYGGSDLVSIVKCEETVRVKAKLEYIMEVKYLIDDYARNIGANVTYSTPDGMVLDENTI